MMGTSCVLLYDCKQALIGSSEGNLCSWKMRLLQPCGVTRAHEGVVYDLKSTEGSSRVISAGDDNVAVWSADQDSGEIGLQHRLSIDAKVPLNRVPEANALYARSDEVLVGYGDGVLRCWNLNTTQIASEWTDASSAYSIYGISGTDSLIAAACSDGRIRLWDTRAGHSIRQLSAFLGKDSGYASCIAIDDSGEWMIVGNSCRYSLIFHIPSGQVLRALPTKGITRSIGFLDYGRIVTVASDGVVYGWDLEGEPTFRIEVGYPLLHLDTWESSLLTCGASDKASFIPNVMFRPVQFHIHSPRS